MGKPLDKRVALVTGGSKGIGRAIVQSLAEEGATVIVIARREDSLLNIKQEMSSYNIIPIVADATKKEEVDRAIIAAIDHCGFIDILVNNVGGAIVFKGFDELTTDDWIKAYELNVLSMVYFVSACSKHLCKSKYGRIINISSLSGIQPGAFNPHYTVTKAATMNLSKFLSNYFAGTGVLVNTVCPGPVHSDSWNSYVQRLSSEHHTDFQTMWSQVEQAEAAKIPLGRVGDGEDVAGLVAFLASDKAGWITGSCFHVNGGKLHTI